MFTPPVIRTPGSRVSPVSESRAGTESRVVCHFRTAAGPQSGRSHTQVRGNTVGELTRLGFIKSSASAAAGLTVLGGLAAGQAEAKAAEVSKEPVVAYLKDPSSGVIAVMSGDREVTVRDEKLAARIAQAAH